METPVFYKVLGKDTWVKVKMSNLKVTKVKVEVISKKMTLAKFLCLLSQIVLINMAAGVVH